jgi:UrcA family protein
MIHKALRNANATRVFHAVLAAVVTTATLHGANAAGLGLDEPLRVVVKYGDLDLRRPADAARLYARIRLAASQVCAPLDDRDLMRRNLWNHCLDGAIAQAVSNVHSATLNAYHRSKGHSAEAAAALAGLSQSGNATR